MHSDYQIGNGNIGARYRYSFQVRTCCAQADTAPLRCEESYSPVSIRRKHEVRLFNYLLFAPLSLTSTP